MSSWVNVTPRLESGLQLSNKVDNGKFRLLVNRICQTLQADCTKIFSDEEEEKLQASLDLSKDNLLIFLDALVSIYKQAAGNIVKPSVLEAALKEVFKINDDKIQILSHAWVTYGKGIVANLRQQSVFPVQVTDIDWSLNIQTSSSSVKKDVRPVALLEMSLTGQQNTKLTLEFNKKELTDLYDNLEKIQAQLDALK